jgi:hypothetical protein
MAMAEFPKTVDVGMRIKGLPPLQDMSAKDLILVGEIIRLRRAVAELTTGIGNAAFFLSNGQVGSAGEALSRIARKTSETLGD